MGTKLSSLSVVGIIAVALSGCLDGPGLFEQDGSASAEYAMVTNDDGGILSGAFDPNSSATQVMSVSGSSSISGASVSFPPGALSIDTNISLQEGSEIANSALMSELNINGNVESAGSALVIGNGAGVDADKDFELTVPRNQGSSLALQSSEQRLIVVYRYKRNGEFFAGIIPNAELTIKGGGITFKTRFFGSYQAALTDVVIEKKVEKASDTPILTKIEETKLEPMELIVGTVTSDVREREIKFPIRVKGAEKLVRCSAFVHKSTTEPAIKVDSTEPGEDLSDLSTDGDVYHFEANTNNAVTRYFRFACTDVTGRSGQSKFHKGTLAELDTTGSGGAAGGSAKDLTIKGWADPYHPYTNRYWDQQNGVADRAIAGDCDSGKGPVQIRVSGHTAEEAQTNIFNSVPCNSDSFQFNLGWAPGNTGHVNLPAHLGGFTVEVWQQDLWESTIIIKGNSSTHTVTVISDRSGMDGITTGTPSATIQYILTDDIEMGGCASPWVGKTDFQGVFVGDGYSIDNMCIKLSSTTSYTGLGLFNSTAGAIISQVDLWYPILDGYTNAPTDVTNAGLLVGFAGGTIIHDVYIDGGVLDLSGNAAATAVASNTGIGGIVGVLNGSSSLSEAEFSGDVIAPNNQQVGGLVGSANSSGVFDVYAGLSGDVVLGEAYVGGVAGLVGSVDIHGAASLFGSVEANGWWDSGATYLAAVGGIVGSHDGDGAVASSLSLSDIYVHTAGYDFAGGIAGKMSGHIIDSYAQTTIYADDIHTGGVTGYLAGGHGTGGPQTNGIKNSYAVVDFDDQGGSGYCGGLVGFINSNDQRVLEESWSNPEVLNGCSVAANGSIGSASTALTFSFGANIHFSSSTISNVLATGPVSRPLNDFQTNSDVYNNWDFNNVWYFNPDNDNLPDLQMFQY